MVASCLLSIVITLTMRGNTNVKYSRVCKCTTLITLHLYKSMPYKAHTCLPIKYFLITRINLYVLAGGVKQWVFQGYKQTQSELTLIVLMWRIG